MKPLVIYIHGKGGSPSEAEHYRPLFPEYEIIGLDYQSETPWDAEIEFRKLTDPLFSGYGPVILIANSIGAYFAMHALADEKTAHAFLISPVVDMESLITGMMRIEGVSEEQLREQKVIVTSFKETLSSEYLDYVRAHPLNWNIPTDILYGDQDHLTSADTIASFAEKTGAALHIMKGGEHWFHTKEQMRFLDEQILQAMKHIDEIS